MSIGLALSGGGVKGAAHIGVLQAFKEENIKIDYISGTSSGSIVAALYAAGYTPYNILSMFNTYCKNIADYDKLLPFKLIGTVFTGKISIKGFAKGQRLESLLYNYFKSKDIFDISQIEMPLAIPTVDLYTGEVIYFLSKDTRSKNSEFITFNNEFDDEPTYNSFGDLASIVRASSSFPGVFEPKIINKKVLVDGGVRVNSPVTILRELGADKVITVSFDKNDNCKTANLNIVSVAMKSFDIMGHQVNHTELETSDYILRPDLDQVTLLEFEKTGKLATQGYMAAKKEIKRIKEKCNILS